MQRTHNSDKLPIHATPAHWMHEHRPCSVLQEMHPEQGSVCLSVFTGVCGHPIHCRAARALLMHTQLPGSQSPFMRQDLAEGCLVQTMLAETAQT